MTHRLPSRTSLLRAPLAALLATLLWPSAGSAATPTFAPCRIAHPLGLAGIEAECAALEVPESDAPGARWISLSIARVRAVSREKSGEPLFLIAGGPGMGTQAMYAGVASVFRRVNREHDIVLVDQRGTGRSAPLECDQPDEDDVDLQRLEPAVRECLASLQKNHDVAQYTTSRAVRDLDAVRRALGYARINLYGVSYGTRVAQHFLRRYPEHTRSVILDGVVSPDRPLGPDLALDADAAVQRIFARCRNDGACRAAFGDPLDDYRLLHERLGKTPQRLAGTEPTEFGLPQLRVAMRLSSYAAAQAALLPLALHRAARADDFTALASLYSLSLQSLEHAIAAGMHNSVVCAEDLPFVAVDAAQRAKLAATYLGTDMFDTLVRICALWPRGPVDADFHVPVRSAVPVLLLSGSDDPVTPPSNAVAAMKFLTRARHVLLAGEGHGQLGVRCMDRVFEEFLRHGEPAKLDLTCLDKRVVPPFFLTPAGPGP